MGLPMGQQMKYWSIFLLLFLAILWFLGGVILPFVLGAAIAYFLDPLADRLQSWGCSRVVATAIITLSTVVIFLWMILLILPTLIQQSIALIETAPALFARVEAFLIDRFPALMDSESQISQSLASIGEAIKSRGGALFAGAVNSALNFLNVILLLFIVPVVAFYLLLDWDRMVAKIDSLLPRDHAPVVRQLAGDIDKMLASFVRGQGTVCLILGAYYAIALALAGLNFGLVVGLVAGVLTFIPYIGALVGGALAIGLALFQFWGDWWSIGVIAVIFVVGQIIEGNVLTPKLVGSSVGLHPVWLLFALAAFGTLFGFVGLLVAVPVAAAIGVIVRFALDRYKEGQLYRGQNQADED